MIRYGGSLGRELMALKNRLHSLLARNSVEIDASDISMKRSLEKCLICQETLRKLVIHPCRSHNRFKTTSNNIGKVKDRLESIGKDMENVRILISLPAINYYFPLDIYSEIGALSRFPDADHLASYTGLFPKVDQSGSVAI
ncbi:MAG: transposase [Thermoplasmatales archaeon]